MFTFFSFFSCSILSNFPYSYQNSYFLLLFFAWFFRNLFSFGVEFSSHKNSSRFFNLIFLIFYYDFSRAFSNFVFSGIDFYSNKNSTHFFNLIFLIFTMIFYLIFSNFVFLLVLNPLQTKSITFFQFDFSLFFLFFFTWFFQISFFFWYWRCSSAISGSGHGHFFPARGSGRRALGTLLRRIRVGHSACRIGLSFHLCEPRNATKFFITTNDTPKNWKQVFFTRKSFLR